MSADDGTTYRRGDLDPTPKLSVFESCPAESDNFSCTWPLGHSHPQHIAGGDRTVQYVWPAADNRTTYRRGDPDPTAVQYLMRGFCRNESGRYSCTWQLGHTHPQHVAGNGLTVRHVWPVTA